MNKLEKIEQIHESLFNGQSKQAVEQMKEYGMYDFFDDYGMWLEDIANCEDELAYFQTAVNVFMRLEYR
jgi:hypothetical protein